MQLVEVNTKRTIKSFHHLPFKLYKNNKVWIAHLRQDIESVFDKNKKLYTKSQTTSAANDLCLHWHVKGLSPGRRYSYALHSKNETVEGADCYFITATEDNSQNVKLLFGSCADIKDSPL